MIIYRIAVFFCLHSTVLSLNLECDRKNTDCNHIENIPTCLVQNAVFTSVGSKITSIDNKDESTTMEGLFLKHQTVHYLPSGLEKFFPNLQALSIYSSSLKSIEKADLKQFKHLKCLGFGLNNLGTLASDLFEFNTKLEWIYFYGNPLKHVGENILTPLISLKYANFENSNCINQSARSARDLVTLTSKLKRNCPESEEMKMRRKCSHDIDELNKIILELTNELQIQKQEVADLKGKLEASHLASRALDGNLDTATRQLFMASEQIKFNKESANELITDRKLVLICRREANSEICNAIDLRVKSSNTQVIRIEDENGTSIGSNVKSLMIVNQQTFFLPTNLAEHLPAIEDLIVDSSGFYEITSSTFEGMTTLTSLSLPRNKLYVIPTNAFKDLTNLKELDLSQNKLTSLETGAFNGLVKLEKITLNDNYLTVARSDVFGTLISLKHLLFGDNKLIAVGADLLSKLTNIESADFKNNLCINTSFPSRTIQNIEAFISLNWDSSTVLICNIEELPSFCKADGLNIEHLMTKVSKVVGRDIIVNPSLVTTLIVADQSIKFMPHQLAQVLPNLQSITVTHSGLSSLQRSDFEGFTWLLSIKISSNNVSEINDETFEEVKQIEHLDLSSNNIESLGSRVFYHLIRLKTLILTENKIARLTAEMIPPKNAIETLKVDHNSLNSIDTNIIRYLIKVNTIDFSANQCINDVYENGNGSGRAYQAFLFEIVSKC